MAVAGVRQRYVCDQFSTASPGTGIHAVEIIGGDSGVQQVSLQEKSSPTDRLRAPAIAFCRCFSAACHASKRSNSSGVSNGGSESKSASKTATSRGVAGQG